MKFGDRVRVSRVAYRCAMTYGWGVQEAGRGLRRKVMFGPEWPGDPVSPEEAPTREGYELTPDPQGPHKDAIRVRLVATPDVVDPTGVVVGRSWMTEGVTWPDAEDGPWFEETRRVQVVEVAVPWSRKATVVRALESDLEPVYVTRTGRVLTNADIDALAQEAERGYDVSHLRRTS